MSDPLEHKNEMLNHLENVSNEYENEEEKSFTWQSIAAIATIMAVYQSYLFTLIMPAAILAYINADLGPSPIYTWIAVSWNLGAAVMVSIGGRLADIFGRRYFYMAGPFIGCIGAIVGATGQSIGQMIASGVLFGIGGGLGEMSLGLVQEFVPNRRRITVLGACDASATISAFGPLIAYAMIAHTGIQWRAVYWFCFSLEVVTTVCVFFFYHPPSFKTKHEHEAKSKMDLLLKLDYLGLLLFAAGLTLLLMGISWGGGAHPWKSSYVIATIVIGFCLLVGLGFWSAFANLEYPLIPRRLFKDFRRFTVSCVFIAIANSLYYALGVLWPRQSALLFVPANDIILRGIYANMPSFGTILGGWYASLIVPRIGHEKWQLVAYMTIQTAVVGAMASDGHNKAQAIVLVLIAQTVNIPMTVVNFGMVSLGLENQVDIGISSGLLSSFRLMGGAVATAIYSAIQTSRYAEVLPGKVGEAARASGFTGDLAALVKAATLNTQAAYSKVPGATTEVVLATHAAIQEAGIASYRLVFLVAIAFGCIAIIMALLARPIDPARKSNERAVRLENENQKVNPTLKDV